MGTSAFFHIMIPAQKSPKIRAENHERKTQNSIFWKFLGNHIMEISWKLHDGNFLETICWEIL